jgi:hypothetical protein
MLLSLEAVAAVAFHRVVAADPFRPEEAAVDRPSLEVAEEHLPGHRRVQVRRIYSCVGVKVQATVLVMRLAAMGPRLEQVRQAREGRTGVRPQRTSGHSAARSPLRLRIVR